MLFNSIEFLFFLPVVFAGYWMLAKQLRWQNLFVIAASYIFYGWWNWRFLGLIILASATAYICGLMIGKLVDSGALGSEPNLAKRNRRIAKWVCGANIVVSLGILGVYKYYNFFASNLKAIFESIGMHPDWVTLDLVLPVGISFYTFQAVGYVIDVYRGNVKACRNAIDFFAFLSFFPQLVAGPIERASNLLPQFLKERHFDYRQAVDGMRQMLWGFFKKMVVADSCAHTVDYIFSHYTEVGGINLLAGAVLFSFQMYGDFSGYSDIALGTGKLFGIRLMQNFNFPYFSRSIAEFWSRWHISLSTWFRDYVYIPLGGNRHGKGNTIRNTIIVFMVSGFWHGADWTFISWGAFNAMLFVPLLIAGTSRKYKRTTVASERTFPSLKESCLMAITFFLVVMGRVLYRAESLPAAGTIFKKMFTDFSITYSPLEIWSLVFIALMLVIEWPHRTCVYGFQLKETGLMKYRACRWMAYLGLVWLCLICTGKNEAFIYFQF